MQHPHVTSDTGIVGQCGNCLRTVWADGLSKFGCNYCILVRPPTPPVPLKGGVIPEGVGGPFVDKKKGKK